MNQATAEVIKALMVMSELYDKTLSNAAAEMLVEDLEGYPSEAILQALNRCRRELRTFPTVADIVSRMDDGRPGVEEAWALIPKDEDSSVVWTEEMRDAFNAARPLLMNGDEVGARMAFKEVYVKLVQKARERRIPPEWCPSLGLDKATHEPVLIEAHEKGLLDAHTVRQLLPDLNPVNRAVAMLEGPVEGEKPIDVRALLKTITKDAPIEKRVAAMGAVTPKVEMTEEQLERRRQELLHQARIIEGEGKNGNPGY